MPQTRPTSFRLPRELLADLQTFANERRWSVSQLLRIIAQEWVAYQKKQRKPKGGR